MKVDKIPDYNFSRSTNQPVFTALKIREPQLWEKEVLDSFVKDKEVQKIVKSFENIGIDLSAARGDKKFPITSDNIFLMIRIGSLSQILQSVKIIKVLAMGL